MSEFDDAISDGFDAAVELFGSTITCNGKSAPCVASSQPKSFALRDSGLWETGMVIVEMKRADFTALGIADRSVVEHDGRKFKVFTIDTDPADPCVRLTLKPHNK